LQSLLKSKQGENDMQHENGHPATPLESAFAESRTTLPVPFSSLSAQVIRDLPLTSVADLQRFEAQAKSELAKLSSAIQAGLSMRFEETAREQLLSQGKDTGTTHIDEDNFDVSIEIGKTVKWDQEKLAEITKRIADNGGDPGEFISVKYAVSEAKYKAWPEKLKKPFEPARTVKPSKPKITLRPAKEDR
jgi:hypothetical protein